MKYIIHSVLLLSVFISCSKNNNEPDASLIGTWQLIETLADPGDGSGTFQKIESDDNITFKTDETFITHGTLCTSSLDNGSTTGTYDKDQLILYLDACSISDLNLSFELNGSELIINLFCIEPCKAKYKKQ